MRKNVTAALRPWETAMLLALCAALLSGVWAAGRQRRLAGELVRLHVTAASDGRADQAVKLKVRDAVLEMAAPALEGAGGAGEALARLEAMLPKLAERACAVSGQTARAGLTEEWFPTREYGDFSLPAGRYTSLRITLGEGRGHNWWCVVYPPLCTGAAEEAVAADLITEDDLRLITGDGEGYVLRFRVIEWWEALCERLDGGRREDAVPEAQTPPA